MNTKCKKQQELEASKELCTLMERKADRLGTIIKNFIKATMPEINMDFYTESSALNRIEAEFNHMKREIKKFRIVVAILGGLIAGNVLAWIIGLIF